MKYLKVLLLAVFLIGAYTSTFAAPSPEQMQQFIQNQPEQTNPLAINAQQAFEQALNNFMVDVQKNNLNDTEKKISEIFESQDFADSLEATLDSSFSADDFDTISTPEQLVAQGQKLLEAYSQNRYIKQLSQLFFANQNKFQAQDIDQKTFDSLVITFVHVTITMAIQMQEMMEPAQ